VLTGIGTVRTVSGDFTIGNGAEGEMTEQLRNALIGIQRGRTADPYGWVHPV